MGHGQTFFWVIFNLCLSVSHDWVKARWDNISCWATSLRTGGLYKWYHDSLKWRLWISNNLKIAEIYFRKFYIIWLNYFIDLAENSQKEFISITFLNSVRSPGGRILNLLKIDFFFFFLLLFVFRNDLLKCGEIHFQTYLFVCMCVCLCLPATCLVSTFLSWRLFQINLLLNNSRIWTLISVLYQLS